MITHWVSLFIDRNLAAYMLARKTLLDYTNLFSLNDYKNNAKIIYKYFKDKYDRRSMSQV